MITYINTFNKIKLGCLAKQTVVYININRKTTELCNLLLRKNIINGYRILQLDAYKVFEVHINSQVKHYDLKNFTRTKKLKNVSFKNATSLNNRHTHSCYIFMTSKGMLSLSDLIKLRTGGKLMFRLK